MKPTTLEWISKAEDDFNVAQMSYRARRHPSYDAAVFHCQQCAEKYLKARLEEAGIPFLRTHDLLLLHQKALAAEPSWIVLQSFLIVLSPYAVAYRYPGISATKLDARDVLKNCREVRGSFEARLVCEYEPRVCAGVEKVRVDQLKG